MHDGNVRCQHGFVCLQQSERDGLWNQRGQSVRAGSVGAEGKNQGAAAERLRTQGREGIYDVAYDSFLPQLNLGMGGVPKRAVFVVDRNGIIQYAECDDDARGLPNFDKVKAKLAELK